MRDTLLFGCLAVSLLTGGAAFGQTADAGQPAESGKVAGGFLVRGRIIDVSPQNSSSSISPIGGKVNATDTPAPEIDFSYFFTDHLALELIAATTRHELSASKIPALGGANLQVGHTWVLPPSLTAQYHFNPHGTLSPYLGAGINYTFFYDSEAPTGSPVTRVALKNNVGWVVQAGVDWNVQGRWFVNLDVKQIFLDTTAKLTTTLGPVKAKTALNPTVVGAGLGYRF